MIRNRIKRDDRQIDTLPADTLRKYIICERRIWPDGQHYWDN